MPSYGEEPNDGYHRVMKVCREEGSFGKSVSLFVSCSISLDGVLFLLMIFSEPNEMHGAWGIYLTSAMNDAFFSF